MQSTSVVVELEASQFDAAMQVAPPSKVLALKGIFYEQYEAYVPLGFDFVDADPS